jgi:hypothetical protein
MNAEVRNAKLDCRFRLLVNVAMAIVAGSASAQDTATPPATNRTDAASAARLDAMRQIIKGIKVETIAEASSHPIPQVEGPSFRYDAPDVSCDDGTAWIWGEEKKRPTVILTLSSWPSHGFWSYEFTTLCSQKLHIVGKNNVKWTPREGGLQFSPLPDALTPAETPARRLTQLKTMRLLRDHFSKGTTTRNWVVVPFEFRG